MIGDGFLNLTQTLLSAGRELAVGELHQQLAAFILGAQGMDGVAVRLLHLAEVNIANLVLRFGGFFQRRIEKDEVLVFGFGLRQPVRAALAEPGVGDGELGLGQEFTGVVGIDQRIERQPRDLVAASLNVLNGLVEQDLVRLQRIFRDGVFVFAAPAAERERQAHHQQQRQRPFRPGSIENHAHNLTHRRAPSDANG